MPRPRPRFDSALPRERALEGHVPASPAQAQTPATDGSRLAARPAGRLALGGLLTAMAAVQLVAAAPAAASGFPGAKKLLAGRTPTPVTTEDYAKFERIGQTLVSPDGRWVAYAVSRVDGDRSMRLRALAGEGETVFEHAGSGRFSEDGRWFATVESVSAAKRDSLRKAGKPVPSTLILHDLVGGETSRIERISSYTFSPDSQWVSMQRRPERPGGASAGIVIRELDSGRHTSFGGVTSSTWNDEGAMLAMVVAGNDDEDGNLQLFEPAAERLRTLDWGGAGYVGLTWRRGGADLAAMRVHEFEGDVDATHRVLAWRGLDSDAADHLSWDHLAVDADADGDAGEASAAALRDVRVVTFAGLRWSDDGERLAFGVAPWEKRPAETEAPASEDDDDASESDAAASATASATASVTASASAGDAAGESAGDGAGDAAKPAGTTLRDTLDEAAGVDVWHARDIEVIPLQKRRAGAERRKSQLGLLHLDDARFVQLATAETDRVILSESFETAVALSDERYREQQRFGPTEYDVHVVNTETGEHTPIVERVKYALGLSPDGQTMLYMEGGDIMAVGVDVSAFELGVRPVPQRLTEGLGVPFANPDVTVLTDEKPPFGLGGFTKDSDHFVAYDQFDAWMIALDGSGAERLTRGREDQVVHRLFRPVIDPDDPHLDADEPMLFTLYGEWTKNSGLARRGTNGRVERLRWGAMSVGRIVRARDADIHVWSEGRFDDSPDLMVAAAGFDAPRQISETNAFLAGHQWGKSELIDYVNARGEKMQGALMYPANYEPGKQYPMVTYIYERLSQGLHRFQAPSETSPYNAAVFTSDGYFYFMPDITYRAQEPGVSSVECVVPAVEAVLATGMIDPERVGIMGHSWGAYQTAYLVTHSDIFAAGVAGAPLTNMISMSMSLYWNSGQTNAWIFHESQGRMDRPFWQDLSTYVRNSPVFGIDQMEAPLLVAFGDEDGAVDWQQGIEMYNAARLANKQFVMLVYEGENHGLRRRPNQVDYHHRIREWFGHYLKDQDAPSWITEGTPYLERQRELEASGKTAVGGSGGGSRPGTARSR